MLITLIHNSQKKEWGRVIMLLVAGGKSGSGVGLGHKKEGKCVGVMERRRRD